METPANVSLPEGFEQTVEHLIHYNLVFNDTLRAYTFRVRAGEYFEGFFVSKLKTCGKPLNITTSYLSIALMNPRYNPFRPINGTVPTAIMEDHVKPTIHDKVVEVVVPAYEEWFQKVYGISIESASPLGVAATAAWFVYLEYFNYTIGEVPRDLNEVIETRRGDCDDMSRVLVELLNYYGIPSLLVSGYVYIDRFRFEIPIRNTTYVFINNGPHAFTMAHVPELGWISLDFLAGSLLDNLFVIEGYTKEISTPSREEIEEFYDLHSAINATQIIAIFTEDSLKEHVGMPITVEKLHGYFSSLLRDEARTTSYDEATPIATEHVTHSIQSSNLDVSASDSTSAYSEHSGTETRRELDQPSTVTLTMVLLVIMFGAVILVCIMKMANYRSRSPFRCFLFRLFSCLYFVAPNTNVK